eukprot:6813004-Pyramimonas_sp.AAC.1
MAHQQVGTYKPHVGLDIRSATAEEPLELPGQHGGCPIADKYRNHRAREHARACVGALYGAPTGGDVQAAR